MEQWWNDTDRGKPMYWEKNIIQRRLQMNESVWSNDGMILTGENPLEPINKFFAALFIPHQGRSGQKSLH
jgi:hypothetical protein